VIFRTALAITIGLASAALAEPLAWRDATRTLAFDENSSMTLEFMIVDMPNGDQLRLTCQLDKGRKRPVFQVLFQESDAQRAVVSVILGEGAKQEQVDVGPLVYRSLEGIRAPAPEGVLARMKDADWMMVKMTGSDWQNVNQESSAAVLPRLRCFRNN
jgi:hypothetical protein